MEEMSYMLEEMISVLANILRTPADMCIIYKVQIHYLLSIVLIGQVICMLYAQMLLKI